MAYWVVDLFFPVWLHVFLDGESTLSFVSLRRAAIRGERRSVIGSAALGCATTLGCGTTVGGSTIGGGILGGSPVG